MSEYEIRLNKGSIFKNSYKKQDTHPDYKGKINVDGVIKEISLWVNETAKGVKYFGVRIDDEWKKEEEKEVADTDNTEPQNDDLPF